MSYYKKTKFPGVYKGPNSIQIDFRYAQQRPREAFKLEPTAANLQWVANERGSILNEIEKGTFNYAERFPNSKWLKKHAPKTSKLRVRDMIENNDIFLGDIPRKNTLAGYDSGRRAIKKFLGDIFISNLTLDDIERYEEHLRRERGIKTKTVREYSICLSHLCTWAKKKKILKSNPFVDHTLKDTNEEKTDKVVDDKVLAFDVSEINLLIKAATGQIANLIQFAIFSGLRPSEFFALTWENVDLVARTISIEFSISRGNYNLPKTKKSYRTISLNNMAYEAIVNQRQHTYMKPPTSFKLGSKIREGIFVFYDPVRNKPWTDDQRFAKTFWRGLFKKQGLRYLWPYSMRHTYASLCIAAGEDRDWIARQMGTSVEMLRENYGHWLKEAEKLAGREGGDKLDGLIDKLSPSQTLKNS